jgi:hypothetical protein
MAVRDWHPAQLGIFWLLLALFGFPIWVVLARGAVWLVGRYRYQDWFEVIPIVLAFLVVFAVVSLGLSVTWKWLDARQAEPQA